MRNKGIIVDNNNRIYCEFITSSQSFPCIISFDPVSELRHGGARDTRTCWVAQ